MTRKQERLTTLSGRFDSDEIRLVEDAASRKRWSLAQLLKNGTVEKAAGIVNASGGNAYFVRGICQEIARQLLEPRVQVRVPDDSRAGRRRATPQWETNQQGAKVWENQDDLGPDDVRAEPLAPHTLTDFLKLIRLLGSELAPILCEEVQRIQTIGRAVSSQLVDPADLKTSIGPAAPMQEEAS